MSSSTTGAYCLTIAGVETHSQRHDLNPENRCACTSMFLHKRCRGSAKDHRRRKSTECTTNSPWHISCSLLIVFQGAIPTSARRHGVRSATSATRVGVAGRLLITRYVLLRLTTFCFVSAVAPSLAHAEIVFKSSPPTSVDEGQRYEYELRAEERNNKGKSGKITYAAPLLPDWLTFDGKDEISGRPDAGDAGSHSVRVTASVAVKRRYRVSKSW